MTDDANDATMSAAQARLLAELRTALGPDPAPPGLVERAEGLFAFKDFDAVLAELLDRSGAEPAGMRGAAAGERMEFGTGDGGVALELMREGDRIVGQVLGGDVVAVTLERPAGIGATIGVDELGRFSFDQIAAGPARLRLIRGADAPVITDWFLL